MSNKSFSMLDLMGLPAGQQEVALYLVEHGSQTQQELTTALSIEPSKLTDILNILMDEGYVSQTEDGAYQVEMGKRNFRQKPTKKETDEADDFSSLIGDALDGLMNFDDE